MNSTLHGKYKLDTEVWNWIQEHDSRLLSRYWQNTSWKKHCGKLVTMPERSVLQSSDSFQYARERGLLQNSVNFQEANSSTHWLQGCCRAVVVWCHCRKYSPPPPEQKRFINIQHNLRRSTSISIFEKAPDRSPPSTPPYPDIRHSRRSSHQILEQLLKIHNP